MSLHIRMNGVFNKMVRGILLIFALSFLFQCGKSDDSAKDVDPPLVTLKFSAPEVTFNDVDGATGDTYTISASRPPSAGETIEVTLTSTNSSLVVSPTKVTFTSTNASPQTVTVKRANDAADFIMTEITGAINHDIATGAEFAEFAMMESTVNVTVTLYIPDSDGDGLIEISSATMLNNMRYDLAGTSYKTLEGGATGNDAGCPASGCNGYELTANIDLLPLLDANGSGMIDMMKKTVAGVMHTVIDVSKDTSWSPVGDGSTGDDASRFTGTFEGNGHTIANLWVNVTSSSGDAYAGLFGATGEFGAVAIRNVGVVSGGVTSSSAVDSLSGGLVGEASSLTIANSYFSGEGGVSSSSSSSSSSSDSVSSSGGLVGFSSDSLTVTDSYFSGSGGVSCFASTVYSGGLVGVSSSLTVTSSYFSGSGGVSSSSSGSFSFSGGLVGGGSPFSAPVITNSYWNQDAPQLINESPQTPKIAQGDATADPTGAVGLTLTQLQATSGTYPNLLGPAWDLGTDQQLPAVKLCILDMAGTGTCASYGALLGGQR